jgi:type II secretory pathway component PulF
MIFTPAQLNRRAELYYQLGAMITAGVPLIQALQMAANSASLRASRKTISDLIGHLQNGLTFGDSMARTHGWMPEFDKALLSAGEHSGRLDYSFKVLGTHYSTRATILRDTITSLILPVVNLHVFLLVFPLGFLTDFARGLIYNDYLLCIPFIIEKVAIYGVFWGAIILLIFLCQGRHGEGWRSFVQSVSQLFPMLGTALKYLALARLAAALEALVNSGTSIIKSWPMAGAASGSVHLKREISGWDAELEQGHTPAELVSRTHYFPEMFKNLYHTGEISGRLDESLNRLQTYYQEEGFRKMRMFSRILSGTIYGLVAALIAYNVIKFWLNYYGGLMNGV